MKVAIVHDQLQEFGGAERVLVTLMEMYPNADLYTAYYTPEALGEHQETTKNWHIIPSWFDRVPGLKRLASPLRFLTPFIWESINLSAYDLVISSSGTMMCKGVITRPETTHICYIHHPPRYLYYYETAVEWQKHLLVKIYGNIINRGLREWDFLSSTRVDYFIANANETRSRIQKCYRRDGEVIYPPVAVPDTEPEYKKLNEKEYYITVSRLARAKHVDVLIEAANTHKFHLKVIGKGRDLEYLKSIAGDTVEFLSGLTDQELANVYDKAKAFLFASRDEEFGIAAIEAMGRGVPVIAYASGGLTETVIPGENGYLYPELSADSLIPELTKLEALSDDEYLKMCKVARKESKKYSFESFKKQFSSFVKEKTKKPYARTS